MSNLEKPAIPEQVREVLGVKCRAYAVIYSADGNRIVSQKVVCRVGNARVVMHFDDCHNNGHEYFSVTADIYEGGRVAVSGCCHEEVVSAWPAIEPFLKWHLASVDGPMHYLANTLYFAGDADCNGRVSGQVERSVRAVKFDGFPFPIVMDRINYAPFLAMLESREDFDISVKEVSHDDTSVNYRSKFTLSPHEAKWHECPFDSRDEAEGFLQALKTMEFSVVDLPVEYSVGKPRELDKARRSAVWPEATDEELSVPKEQLRQKLLARLPALKAEFKADMLKLGFVWPDREGV